MTGEMDQLEKAVEREMELLRELPAAVPARACVERVKASVAIELGHAARRRRAMNRVRFWGGVAAALLLALGLTSTVPRTSRLVAADPDMVLNEWVLAWEESSRRLTSLLDGDWIREEFGDDEEGVEIEDLFHSLDESFGRFEAL